MRTSVLDSMLLRRALVAVVIAEHVAFVLAPVTVLLLPIHHIGSLVLHGKVPYRDFPFEYPALAALTFAPAGGLHGTWATSQFALQAVLAEALLVTFVLRRRAGVLPRWLVLSLFVFPFLSGGFDGWVMLAVAWSTALLADNRPGGWWVVAAGTALKLTPAAALVWARTRWREAVVAMAVGALATLGPLAWSPGHNADFLGYARHRGAQIESVPASLTVLVAHLAGHAPRYVNEFGSVDVRNASTAIDLVLALGLVALVVIAVRTRHVDPWFAAFVTMTVVLAANKVLSPQYVSWPAPLAAVVGGRWFWGYAGVAALTAVPYVLGASTVDFAIPRNALLVVVAVAGVTAVARGTGPRITAG